MTRSLRRALLALACLALAGAAATACGEQKKEQTAAEILRQTFRSSAAAIDSGRLNLSFRLDPEGLLAVGGPVKLTLEGPFIAPRTGELPRLHLDFVATLAEKPYSGSLLSSASRARVALDDGTYAVDGALVDRLRRAARSQPRGNGLPVVGFDPLRWISGATRKGNERVAGVDTIRIGGRLNVERLLADFDGLLTKAGGRASGSALLSPTLRRQIAGAVDSTAVDVWTGASDRIVRQLAVKVVFFFKDGSSPLQALNGGTINLRLRFDDVNAVDQVTIPRGDTRPLAALTGGGADRILKGIGAGLTGGRGRELFACLTAASGGSSKLVRCVAKLAP